MAENNYFLNVNNPFSQMYSGNDWDANYGDIESRGNIFDKSRGTQPEPAGLLIPAFITNTLLPCLRRRRCRD